jgi:hypothetical protein
MKLSNKVKSALASAGYPVNESSAIAQLVAFAAQGSGIDRNNYYAPYDQGDRLRQGVRAYQQECRSISEDWRRFKRALQEAGEAGVTDTHVIAASPGAFSGRLEWTQYTRDGELIEGQWSYCTRQYFPTEYRKAAATVLEYATREVRRSRPPQTRTVRTIAELKALNKANGGCWFDAAEMRFFGTRIESGIIGGRYFITSEQQDDDKPRRFSVRSFDDKGNVDTVGKFHAYDTKEEALAAIPTASEVQS